MIAIRTPQCGLVRACDKPGQPQTQSQGINSLLIPKYLLMIPREEILKHKELHVQALKETIDKYNKFIEGEGMLNLHASLCPLCILDEKLGRSNSYPCHNCIHYSEFSQGKHCSNQKSFNNLCLDSEIKDVKIRRNYLITVLKRLEEAS